MASLTRTIAVLPGDGIGPEIIGEAVSLLEQVGKKFGETFQFDTGRIGGIAIDEDGTPLPDATVALCEASEAVLLGAVGGPKWDKGPAAMRPETGLLGIRKALGLYANLRPISVFPSMLNASTLKSEVLANVDILMVRELTGGLYFGQPRGRRQGDHGLEVVDTLLYTEAEIERILRLGFTLAMGRGKHLHSIDKANVLDSSRLWREIADRLAAEYPDVTVVHMLVDNAAMQLVKNPRQFDVMVTENMFGDILSDEAAMITGSLGMLPSASLGGDGPGLYEPIHGSAPDIAGQGIANPLATFLSVALLLRHSLALETAASAVESAVKAVLDAGWRTGDIAEPGVTPLSTRQISDKVFAALGAM